MATSLTLEYGLFPGVAVMGATGLEPVTPSLSSAFGGHREAPRTCISLCSSCSVASRTSQSTIYVHTVSDPAGSFTSTGERFTVRFSGIRFSSSSPPSHQRRRRRPRSRRHSLACRRLHPHQCLVPEVLRSRDRDARQRINPPPRGSKRSTRRNRSPPRPRCLAATTRPLIQSAAAGVHLRASPESQRSARRSSSSS